MFNYTLIILVSGLLFVTLAPAVSLGLTGSPLATSPNGTSGIVDGDLYVGAYQPVPLQYNATSRDVYQNFTLPDFTSVAWARLYLVVYSGATPTNWPLRAITSFNGGNGTYVTLGDEVLNVSSTVNGYVYWANDHCSKVCMDYTLWYDVTGLINGVNTGMHFHDQKVGTSNFNGMLKAVELVVAYNNGSGAVVNYWVNPGQHWVKDSNYYPYTNSGSTTFDASSVSWDYASAVLTELSTSGAEANYSFNGMNLYGAGSPAGCAYFENNSWDVTDFFIPESENVYSFTKNGFSYQTQTATLAVTTFVPPVASFTANVTSGNAPLAVAFNSSGSTGTITSYSWNFGDGNMSSSRNPVHTYNSAGNYTVNLTVAGPYDSDTMTRSGYINASAAATSLSGLPLATYPNGTSGTVDGGLYVGAFQPVPFGSQPLGVTSRDIYQNFTLPDFTSVEWARLYLVIYSGNTPTGWPLAAITSFNGGNGTYVTLGDEVLNVSSTVNGYAYWANNHCSKVCMDYTLWYDVKDLITGGNTGMHFHDQKIGNNRFNGALKAVELVVAYNNGSGSVVQYWVNPGQNWVKDGYYYPYTDTGSTVFATSSVSEDFVSARLTELSTSQVDADYTFNGLELYGAGSPIGFGYFENNTWDVTDIFEAGSDSRYGFTKNGFSYQTQTATLAVTTYIAPVANFTANVTSGNAPLTVAFDPSGSTGTIASYLWDFGDNNTSTERNPMHTYAAAGNYTVNLTINGPAGSDTCTKTNYISVRSPHCDLSIISVSSSLSYVFTLESNTIAVDVKNNGPLSSPATTVGLRASDGFVGNGNVPILASGAHTVINIEDTTLRPLQGITVNYTAVVDPGDAVPETNESNNVTRSIDYTVLYNGYKGKRYMPGGSDIVTRRTYEVQGNLTYSQGDSIYRSGFLNHTVTWTGSQPSIPAGADVVEAYLYVSWTWDNMGLFPGMFYMMFNGQPVANVSGYTDKKNFAGTYAHFQYGLATYNVTQLYMPNSVNTLQVCRLDGHASSIATFPVTLMVIYRYDGETFKQIFVNEEYDLLAPSSCTQEEATAFAPFGGMTIDLANVSGAMLCSFATNAGPGEGNLAFNGNLIAAGAYHGTGSTSGGEIYDVTGMLNRTGNIASIQATDSAGMGAIQQVLVVSYPAATPAAVFSANVTSGDLPLTVSFDPSGSTGTITSYLWDFGDDNTSNVKAPVHTYYTQGAYTVNLTLSGPAGNDTESRANYILVGLSAPVAAFNATPTSGRAPLEVSFDSDGSTGSITSYLWSFGDGNTSAQPDPVYTYHAQGNYTVSLTVSGPLGNNTMTRVNYIAVDYAVPVAAFSGTPTSGGLPLNVSFDSGASTGVIDSYLWDFGDGSNSTLPGPVHTYAAPGVYTVNLTVSGPGGSDSKVVASCVQVSGSVSLVRSWSEFNYPSGLAADANGNLFVSDAENARIMVVYPNGSVGVARNDVYVGIPQGLAVDSSGNLYVADCGYSVVNVFHPDGSVGTVGSGFSGPMDVAVDAAGNVFVADSGNNAVYEVFVNGTVVTLDTDFNGVWGIDVDQGGNVYVADCGGRVKNIHADGSIVTLASGFSCPSGLAVDASGNVFVADYVDNVLYKVFPNGSRTLLGGGFVQPLSVAADSSGHVWVGDSDTNSYPSAGTVRDFVVLN